MSDHSAQVQRYLDDLVGRGFVGAVGAVDDHGTVTLASAGRLAVGGEPLPTDAVFRIQSMTKAVTAVATLRLVERGELLLTDPIGTWLPELAAPRVLRTPTADIDDTIAATRAITVRDLLTLTAGHGMDATDSPYARAQADAGVAAGPEPVDADASDWLARLATLPLAHQPGEGWRYHHGFMLLGILLSRLVGRRLGEHLADDVFKPLGMVDTGFWTPTPGRLPAVHRHTGDGLVEVEPAGGGFHAAEPGFDVAHGELVSTAADYLRFARMLRDDGAVGAEAFLTPVSVAALHSDQVPLLAKGPESFGGDFWNGNGWGYGVGVDTSGVHQGRFGWSGGLGTDFSVDPTTGVITILLTQTELAPELFGPLLGFRDVLDAE